MKATARCIVGLALLAGLLFSAGAVSATELIWTPINPSFGGHPNNAAWLMASAQVQNRYVVKPEPYRAPTRDPIADFEERLRSQMLSQLANQIIREAFGEANLLPVDESDVHYSIGTFDLQISSGVSTISITLTDTTTGSTTIVEVPYF